MGARMPIGSAAGAPTKGNGWPMHTPRPAPAGLLLLLHTTLTVSPVLVIATFIVPVGGVFVSVHPAGSPVFTSGPKSRVASPDHCVGSSPGVVGRATKSAVTVSVLAKGPATVRPSTCRDTEYVVVFFIGLSLAAIAGCGRTAKDNPAAAMRTRMRLIVVIRPPP